LFPGVVFSPSCQTRLSFFPTSGSDPNGFWPTLVLTSFTLNPGGLDSPSVIPALVPPLFRSSKAFYYPFEFFVFFPTSQRIEGLPLRPPCGLIFVPLFPLPDDFPGLFPFLYSPTQMHFFNRFYPADFLVSGLAFYAILRGVFLFPPYFAGPPNLCISFFGSLRRYAAGHGVPSALLRRVVFIHGSLSFP